MSQYNKAMGTVRKYTPATLKRDGKPAFVYVYRHLQTGQVAYTQVPGVTEHHINRQFKDPNWENKRPTMRQDLWRPMAVADFGDYKAACDAFDGLVYLRFKRTHDGKKLIKGWRKTNAQGNVWQDGQYRPVYTQEALSDLSSVTEAVKVPVTIHWEDMWRRGAAEAWPENAEHKELNRWDAIYPKTLEKRLSKDAVVRDTKEEAAEQ